MSGNISAVFVGNNQGFVDSSRSSVCAESVKDKNDETVGTPRGNHVSSFCL